MLETQQKNLGFFNIPYLGFTLSLTSPWAEFGQQIDWLPSV